MIKRLLKTACAVVSDALYRAVFRRMFQRAFRDELSGLLAYTVHDERFLRAIQDTVDFVEKEMSGAKAISSKEELLSQAIELAPAEGLHLEFGVFRGHSIRRIAGDRPETPIYGFDSFEGLPESDAIWSKGLFDEQGRLPRVPPNVVLVKGWFEQTLPLFLEEHREDCAFVHIDSDLYSSAKTIFTLLGNRLREGTVIVFDEYCAYPGWRSGEHKAFMEFIAASRRAFTYTAYCERGQQVVVVIGGVNPPSR